MSTVVPPVTANNHDETVLRRRTNRRLTSNEFENDEVFAVPKPAKRSKSVAAPLPVRRSTRISSYNENRSQDDGKPTPKKVAKQSKKTKNQVVSLYFNPTSKNVSKADHKKSILQILNKGNFKDIKMLPSIGDKTAYQIVSFRSVMGKFGAIDDLKKVPAMKGKLWEKFLEVSKRLLVFFY